MRFQQLVQRIAMEVNCKLQASEQIVQHRIVETVLASRRQHPQEEHVVAYQIVERVYPLGGPVQNVANVFWAQVQLVLPVVPIIEFRWLGRLFQSYSLVRICVGHQIDDLPHQPLGGDRIADVLNKFLSIAIVQQIGIEATGVDVDFAYIELGRDDICVNDVDID